MDERFMQQLFAELIDAQEQAIALLAGAVGDITDSSALAMALQKRLEAAQAATAHPIRDKLVATAVRALKAR